jgi:hypothetical protein
MTAMDDSNGWKQWMTAMDDETQQSTKITIYTKVVVVGIHCVYLVVVLKEERGVKRIEVV